MFLEDEFLNLSIDNKKRNLEAEVYRRLLNNSSSDISDVNYTIDAKDAEGFARMRELFMDTMYVCSDLGINELRSELKKLSGIRVDGIVPMSRRNNYKLTLNHLTLDRSIEFMGNTISESIQLLSIDITLDCKRVFGPDELKEFILENIEDIEHITNISKVGRNCLIFRYYLHGMIIKAKIYNKWVQLVESSGVYRNIGSVLHSFVDKDNQLFDFLEEAKDEGFTRIELCINYPKVQDKSKYIEIMDSFLRLTDGAKTYVQSFENHWKLLVDKVYNREVIMVYDEASMLFGYCHWFNKLTGKVQGSIKRNTSRDELAMLISNQSFNDRTTRVFFTTENIWRSYRRTKYGVTLVPGPRGSLYPRSAVNLYPKKGFISYNGMSIGTGITTRNASKFFVVGQNSIEETEDVNNIYSFTYKTDIVNQKVYKPDYSTVEEGMIYKILNYGISVNPYGKEIICALIVDKCNREIRIKCNKDIKKLLEEYDRSPKYKLLCFEAIKRSKYKGYEYMKIERF